MTWALYCQSALQHEIATELGVTPQAVSVMIRQASRAAAAEIRGRVAFWKGVQVRPS